jgi:hypothetical protein
MAPERRSRPRRYRCRYCGLELPAWLPAFQEPDGTRLLQHVSASHPKAMGAYRARIHSTTDVTPVMLEAYDVVEDD